MRQRGFDDLFLSGRARHVALVLLSCCYAVLWVGGGVHGWRGGMAAAGASWLAALFLTLAAMIVLVGARTRSERLSLLAVALVGFAAEVLGVHLGVPFGAYSYTDALGLKLFGVPLAIAFAWLTLAAYVKQMLTSFRLALWLETALAATWLTACDLLIDPLASRQLDYWRWESKGPYFGVPLNNFAGWFVVGLLAFRLLRKKVEFNLTTRLTGLSIILFFTLLAVGLGSNLVALFGCALILIHLVIGLLTKST